MIWYCLAGSGFDLSYMYIHVAQVLLDLSSCDVIAEIPFPASHSRTRTPNEGTPSLVHVLERRPNIQCMADYSLLIHAK